MRHVPLLLLLTILATLPVAAQPSRYRPTGCPIGFGVQINGRAVARTIEDVKKNGDGPQLNLTFRPEDARKILGATFVVHGVLSSPGYLPLDKHPEGNTSQTFELGGPTGLTDTEMVGLSKVIFVSWTELTEIRFANSTIWHTSPDAQCRAVPSRLMLVSATAYTQ